MIRRPGDKKIDRAAARDDLFDDGDDDFT